MAFHEKSAWIMTLALLLGGAVYVGIVSNLSAAAGGLVPPNIPFVAVFTIILVGVAIIGHALIAALSPKDANTPLDERERAIRTRSGYLADYVFGAGVVLFLGLYLLDRNGDMLFYGSFGSLMASQFVEYALRIWFYRSAI